ncbi:DUF1801 domain-containing protein [Caulobacter segnis]|uniref:DUF1801 domain-containing protein n=1 Tax=Caulobacter segnis TaxID=88688 RepID=A0A2W5VC93_9CAUL|nr:DUF1801 domain-containing protein [Caulobacter segnis]PZR37380.1 MAG: DUF1801 domain-containing protein [Caulobacter segnis]
MRSIEDFRSGLDAETLETVDRLRSIAAAAHPDLVERIKWNAPSFALGEDDLITLGLERRGGVRLVLHRGARPKNPAGFAFDDPAGLARWPAVDRGVMVFNDLAAVEAAETAVGDLCARWVARVLAG